MLTWTTDNYPIIKYFKYFAVLQTKLIQFSGLKGVDNILINYNVFTIKYSRITMKTLNLNYFVSHTAVPHKSLSGLYLSWLPLGIRG